MTHEFQSKIYAGSVSHRRRVAKSHEFSYRLFMLYLDLDELPSLASRVPGFRLERWAPLSVYRRDYLPSSQEPQLKDAVIQRIKKETGQDFIGKIFLLTHPRWFGFVINPLSIYYCFDRDGFLKHVVGEITNTPWNERHCYVMSPQNEQESVHKFHFRKTFHVSPFLPMDMNYTWHVSEPGSQLSVDIWSRTEERLDFEAHLTMRAYPLTKMHLLKHWIQHPWITVKVLAGIYWNAGILYFVKKVPFYDHPKFVSSKENL